MTVPTPLTRDNEFGEAQAWESLRRAIATSSGFQKWRQQSGSDVESKVTPLDKQVVDYLRETLETLAY